MGTRSLGLLGNQLCRQDAAKVRALHIEMRNMMFVHANYQDKRKGGMPATLTTSFSECSSTFVLQAHEHPLIYIFCSSFQAMWSRGRSLLDDVATVCAASTCLHV
jgi:hypothetical protein